MGVGVDLTQRLGWRDDNKEEAELKRDLLPWLPPLLLGVAALLD